MDGMVWTELISLRIGTSGGLLWTRQWTFGFHKILGSSWVAAQLAASQEGLSSMSEWVMLDIPYMLHIPYFNVNCAETCLCIENIAAHLLMFSLR
jgi:hypothetical protein